MKTQKFFAMIVIAVSSFTVTVAQTTSPRISADSTVVVDRIYTGIIAGPIYNTQLQQTTTAANIRGGVQVTWKATSQISLRSFAVAEYDAPTKSWLTINSFYGIYTPSKKVTIVTGFGPTLPAKFHRPNPVTDRGHFETFTTKQLPGAAEHINIEYIASQNFTFAGGVSVFQHKPMYATTMVSGKWTGTAYYTSSNNKVGGALTYNGSRLQNTLVIKQDAMVANVLLYSFGKQKEFIFYADNGYDTNLKDMVRTEAGFLRTFTGGRWGGLFGLGYDNVHKTINTYLFVTLK